MIVGAGYTGLSAARYLARAGATVVVVEREQIAWGASSRNGGQVLTGLKLDPAALVARYGEVEARRLFETADASMCRLEAVVAEEQIDCGFARVGHIQAAWKPSHFAAFRDEQTLLARVFRHAVHIVPRAEQRSELGSDAYHGLLVDERSAAVNPAQYAFGLASAAARAGARIVTGVGVESSSHDGRSWTVRTSAGDLRSRDVLFATNGYTGRAAPSLQRRLIPIGSYVIATEPLPRATAAALLPRRRMAFDTKNFLYYFRVTDDDRLLFGGRAEFSRPTADTTRRAAEILRRGMTTIFPELASAAIEYAWAGQVAFTRDQMPHA
ncbi:MAG TPA: FAD-binding oxidoreductase, partial [Rhodanobacteraceae bacterium]